MTPSSLAVAARSTPGWAQLADYAQLIRPRISLMVPLVVAVSGSVATLGAASLRGLGQAMLGTFLIAASASACNQWLERRRDRLMERTAQRPLPAGRMSSWHALLFAAVMGVVGEAWLAAAANWPTAGWGAVTWFLYVCVYTPLKPRTPWNTAVGAVVGAIPVLLGGAAVGGAWHGFQTPAVGSLFFIQFLWQFPHFTAIAWIYREQYAHAGLRMWTVVEPTGWRAGRQAVFAAVALLPISTGPAWVLPARVVGWYLPVVGALGLMQLGAALGFLRRRDERSARRLLRATLVYLPLLLLTLVLAILAGRADLAG